MTLKAMIVFCKVAEKGVMARAANDLNITPAAVSKLVAELEETLGVRLLNRTTRKLKLTEVGLKYYDSCQQVLQQIEDINNQFSVVSTETAGEIKLTAPLSFGLIHLPDLIDQFHTEFPEIQVSLNLQDAVVDLVEDGFDLAIRIQRQMKDSTLIAKSFGQYNHYIVCSRDYYQQHGPIQTPADLQAHTCMAYSHIGASNKWELAKDDEIYTHRFAPSIKINNSLLLKDLMLRGKGLCLLPEFLIGKEVTQQEVIHVLPEFELQQAQGWLVYPSRKYQRPIVATFIDFFHSHFESL